MKRLTLFVVLALFIQSTVSAQPCLPDTIVFSSQVEIDNFQTNYPSCTQIEGTVIIDGDDITNLNGLSVLTSIGIDLEISGNSVLPNLTGLGNLSFIEGNLIIGAFIYNLNPKLKSLTGLEGLTSIGGDLQIRINDSLTNLTGLEGLTSIVGNLLISSGGGMFSNNDPTLENLSGLNNLTSIGGDLIISRNEALTSLTGLDNLSSIGGDLRILKNEALTSLTGLDNVTSLGGSLMIGMSSGKGASGFVAGDGRNAALTSLTGLEGLTSIEGALYIAGNDALTSLTGLDNVISIGGYLMIHFNVSLTSLTGLDNVTSIGGRLWIVYNPVLTNLTGLDNLTSIGEYLLIYNNAALMSLLGLDNLTSIGGGLSIGSYIEEEGYYIGNDALTNLTSLYNLSSIGGDINILGNDTLTSLTGLDNVTSFGGNLSIIDNGELISLTGLNNIDPNSITNLYITNNDSLSSCDAEWLCDYLANPIGSVNIYNNSPGCNNPPEIASSCGFTMPCLPYGNYYFFSQTDIDIFQTIYPNCTNLEGTVSISGDNITNLNGLNVLTSVGGDLFIGEYNDNPNLLSLTGLEGLTSIGGHLSIKRNYALTDLTGLEGLTTIGSSLSIHFNALTSLTGLDYVTSIGGYLGIGHNYSLTICEVQSICEYLANSNGWIHFNAPGCNSQVEVEEACDAVSIEEQFTEDYLSLYPNPAHQELNISVEGYIIQDVRIYNLTGQQRIVVSPVSNKVDISHLQPGMYIVEVNVENTKVRKKLLVQR